MSKAVGKKLGKVFIRWGPVGRDMEFGVVIFGSGRGTFSAKETTETEASFQMSVSGTVFKKIGVPSRVIRSGDKF